MKDRTLRTARTANASIAFIRLRIAAPAMHEPSVAQVLHLLNAPEVQAKLSHEGGHIAKLVKRMKEDGPLVEELYLTFYSRMPAEEERQGALAYLREHKGQRRQAAEDLAWSMLNSLEFVFNH